VGVTICSAPWSLGSGDDDHTERLRQSTTKRLREAIGKIRDADPTLGIHLDEAVRTGTTCTYRRGRRGRSTG